MNRVIPETLSCYDRFVSELIMKKYGISFDAALRRFLSSRTHELLADADNGLTSIGFDGIFDIWESEVVTGDPRNSVYIRGE